MALWLYLHFPSLQLDSFSQQHHDEAIVVVDGRQNLIVQASQSAREHGIKIGMGLGSAAALCRKLQVHPYSEDLESKRIQEIANRLYTFTSDIVIWSSQGLLLKVDNMLTLYQGLDNYWQVIKQALEREHVHYHYSTGFSPFSACLLYQTDGNKLLTDKADILDKIKPLPLEASVLSTTHVQQLNRIGIRTIGELLSLSTADLARRFTIDVVNYVGRLLGQFKHPVTFFAPQEEFSCYQALLYELDNIAWLEKPLYNQLTRLQDFLSLRNQVAYELKITLHQRRVETQTTTDSETVMRLHAGQGEYHADKWWQLCQLRLETVTLEGPVHAINLEVVRSGHHQATHRDMFSNKQSDMGELELIALLQAKLGQTQVCKMSLSDDPRPEQATHYFHHESSNAIQSQRTIKQRPTFLLPQPAPLQHKVTLVHGPERLVTGWWDGQPITRDYFVAKQSEGEWLWVFRDAQQRWFLHGQFS